MTTALNNLEKSVLQVLLQLGLVDDATLKSYLSELEKDFPESESSGLEEIMQKINDNISPFGLSARTLVMNMPNSHNDVPKTNNTVDESGTTKVFYHGVVNIEGDNTAKDLGSNFKPNEVLLFNKMLLQLAETKIMNVKEAIELKEPTMKDSEVSKVIEKLITEGWLSRDRNERGYIEIGLRSYMELQTILQDHVGEAGREQLPQVIIY